MADCPTRPVFLSALPRQSALRHVGVDWDAACPRPSRLRRARSDLAGRAVTEAQARTIACGLLHDGIRADKLSEKAKQELRAAIDALLAAAQTTPPSKD